MARQGGILKVRGKLDDMSFYQGKGRKNKTEHLVRQKGGVSAERIANDPNFQRVRENNSEFARAGLMTKAVYNAFVNVTIYARDGQAASRLTKAFRENLAKDDVNIRGEREIQWDDMAELDGFQFNATRQFNATYGGKFSTVKKDKDLVVEVAEILPLYDIKNQAEASHARLEICVLTIGMDGSTRDKTQAMSFIDCYQETAFGASSLVFEGAAEDAETILICVSVKLFQEMNGAKYLLRNKSFNASTLLPALV